MLKWLLVTLTVLMVGSNAIAQEAGIPESSRPGAAQPEAVHKPAAVKPEAAKSAAKKESSTSTPAAAVQKEMKIPPVIDRPLRVDSGPKVIVKKFRLVNAVDMPKYGISIAAVQKILQGLIDAKPKGFTIGQLSNVATKVTDYYREHQLILAQAVVPVQTVKDGIVDIRVLPGVLGRVLVQGNKMYSAKLLQEPFQKLIDKPVTKASIEAALLELTDYPGLTVFGVFQPGIEVGKADIVLNVQQEKRFDFAYRVDNEGINQTGRFRLRPSIQWNNPTGSADQVSLLLQQSFRPENNIYYSTRYKRYLGHGFYGELFWDVNKFDVNKLVNYTTGSVSHPQIHGETTDVGGSISKTWVRGRLFNLYSNIDLTRKESLTTTRGNPTNRDKLTVLLARINFDHVDTRFRGIDNGYIEISHGFNNLFGAMGNSVSANRLRSIGRAPSVQGSNVTLPNGKLLPRFAEGKFTKINARLQRLQTISKDTTLQLTAEYQWTNDLLVPLEQYTVGGPDNVRAYPQGQHLMDRAVFASAELIQNMPFITDKVAFGNRTWGELVQLSIFYDFARGRLVKPFSSQDAGYRIFMGAGVQAVFNLPGSIESKFISAWPIHINDTYTAPNNDKIPQIWGELTYRF